MKGQKTEIFYVLSRKLAPYVLLFGCYLITYGHISPGGGFQGGVVIASGVVLLALGRGKTVASRLFPPLSLHLAEAISFAVFLGIGAAGLWLLGDFLGTLGGGPRENEADPHGMIFLLNLILGTKVSAGIGLISLSLLKESSG